MRFDIYTNEQEVIEDNLTYALEMYELYPNDEEVIKYLKLKGLNNSIIEQILHKIKQPAYVKRVRQAKRMILTGTILVVTLLLIIFLLKSIPNSESLLQGKADDDKILGGFFRFYSRIYYLVIIFGTIKVLTGITLFFRYKKLLRLVS
jgi:hypothetical protein